MNNHLNLFRFFNDSTDTVFIENNLSRAFALCLYNDSLFLNEYIQSIVKEEDYSYLFSSIGSDTKYSIDIQIDTGNIERESYKTVYAIAMTADRNLDMTDFFSQTVLPGKRNITDIIITIKDLAVIIEVKRAGEDCKEQLYNQVYPFLKESSKLNYTIYPKSYPWQEVIKLMEKVKHVQQLASLKSTFLNDFLELSETRYPEWFEPKPFNVIHFSSQRGTPNNIQLIKRIRQGLAGVSKILGDDYQLLPYADRIGVTVPFQWASEIIPCFATYDDEHMNYIGFNIWPGNTKQQGYLIYDNSLEWIDKDFLLIDNCEYKLGRAYNIKFCHFNRYVSEISYYDQHLIKPTHTKENFDKYSGKWNYADWDDFEKFMDEHIKREYNWREKSKWEEKFTDSDRSYFTISLGFEVGIFIPFTEFKKIDKTESDIANVTDFISKIILAFKGLIRIK